MLKFIVYILFLDIIKNTVKCYVDGMVYNGYPCRNSDVCIPLGWLCDGQRDCLGKIIKNKNKNCYLIRYIIMSVIYVPMLNYCRRGR